MKNSVWGYRQNEIVATLERYTTPAPLDLTVPRALIPSSEQFASLETQVPDLIPYLRRTREEVINVDRVGLTLPSQLMSPIAAVMRLTHAESEKEIGRHGPAVTAVPFGVTNRREVHLFDQARHGRDALVIARGLLTAYPELSRATILYLAQLQGTKYDSISEEEPGRILHEDRDANNPQTQVLMRETGWGFPYYGTIDATPSFVNQIVAHCRQEGRAILREKFFDRDGRIQTIEDSLFAAVYWLARRMDQNPEGLIEFKRTNPDGIENQAWKDSQDAYFHKDGTLANHIRGIAPIEVQVETLNAFIGFLQLYPEYSLWAKRRIARVAYNIMQLWVEDDRGGFFVLGTDRDEQGKPRRLEVLTSNAGYVLNSPLLEGDENPASVAMREKLIEMLFSSLLLATAGIRTLGIKEFRYYHDGYHNGTVWPHDTSRIAEGLERHGYFGLSHELRRRIWSIFDSSGLFPEFVRGDNNGQPTINTCIIDVQTPERGIKRLSQPPQPVLAMSVGAAFETHEVLQRVAEGQMPTQAIDPAKRRFEEQVLASI